MCFPSEARRTAAGSTLGLLTDREGRIDGDNSASSRGELTFRLGGYTMMHEC